MRKRKEQKIPFLGDYIFRLTNLPLYKITEAMFGKNKTWSHNVCLQFSRVNLLEQK